MTISLHPTSHHRLPHVFKKSESRPFGDLQLYRNTQLVLNRRGAGLPALLWWLYLAFWLSLEACMWHIRVRDMYLAKPPNSGRCSPEPSAFAWDVTRNKELLGRNKSRQSPWTSVEDNEGLTSLCMRGGGTAIPHHFGSGTPAADRCVANCGTC